MTAFDADVLADLQWMQVLSYPPQAEALVQAWRRQKIKVGISDMRIAATYVSRRRPRTISPGSC